MQRLSSGFRSNPLFLTRIALRAAAAACGDQSLAGQPQDFADHVSDVMKALAGSEPEIEVRVTIQGKQAVDLEGANQILESVKANWRF